MPPGPPHQPPGNSSWTSSEAIAFGIDAVKNDYVGVALPLVVATLVMCAGAGAVGGVIGLLQAGIKCLGTGVVLSMLNAGVTIVTQVVTMVIQAFILGGTVDFSLQVARGGRPPLDTVFKGSRYFVSLLLGQLLLALVVALGMVLLIVPGIILALGLLFWSYLIVDKHLAPIEAMKASWALTMGHKMNLAVFGILSFLVGLGGLLACCVGVLLGSVPVLTMATAFIYLRLSRETPQLATRR
jgi:uncharacterized membrane protein